MKKMILVFLALCMCLTVFAACGEVDAREDKMDKRKTFSSKEEMIQFLSGKSAREMGISSAGEWAYTPVSSGSVDSFMESFMTERCDYNFDENGKVTYFEKKTNSETDLTEKVTFVPEKGYIILPDGVKLYCEGSSLVEQKDDDTSASEIREFTQAF